MSQVDHNLYSRQIGAFGLETMTKLIKMNVLVIGCRGVGTEIAKNLVLAGPASVTVYDQQPIQLIDLGSNFALGKEDVGKTRSSIIAPALAALNENVRVSAHTGQLDDEFIHNFDVVVTTTSSRSEIDRINSYCRNRKKFNDAGELIRAPIGFIATESCGLSAYVFTDFGDKFAVHDKDGENVWSGIIAGVTKANPGVVTVHEDHPHKLQTGDYVTFAEVEGMVELNDNRPRQVKVIDRFSFSIDDTSSFSEYTRQGLCTQVKLPTELAFRSFRATETNPFPEAQLLIEPDLAKMGRPQQLHIAYQALHHFREEHRRFPRPNNEDDAKAVVEIAHSVLEANNTLPKGTALVVDKVDDDVVRKLALHSAIELSPLASIVGGIVAQEVVKFTGKFTPLQQPLYFDFFECLPTAPLPPSELQLQDTRYDNQIAIFGKSFQAQLANLNYFLVGAGALGCEYLKGFALMGLATSAGRVQVTDMDNIELSNLNRQFLFRKGDIGHPKSVVAARAVQNMNPEFRVSALETRVGADTEAIFDDNFWKGLDGVCNALDNVQARHYVDGKCVLFKKSLLESGTLGTKANSQIVIPFLTQSYSDVKDPVEDAIPLCTLKNFPYKIEHCIEYARSEFEGWFTKAPQDAALFLRDTEKYLSTLTGNTAQKIEVLTALHQTLKATSMTLADCVKEAQRLFYRSFRDAVLDITSIYPEGHVDPKTGSFYWSGPKRFPKPVEASIDDEIAVEFFFSTVNLLLSVYNVRDQNGQPQKLTDRETLKGLLASLEPPSYVQHVVKIEEEEKKRPANQEQEQAAVSENDSERAQLEDLIKNLREFAASSGARQLNPQEFEKDDDSNHHIDFIAAFSNLRARNYRIPVAPRHQVKMIAGKIIPAIATTTAAITGFALMELYKILQKKPLESIRDTCINLAVNLYVFMEPSPPPATRSKDFDPISGCALIAVPNAFTSWDKVEIKGDLTVNELAEELQKYVQAKTGNDDGVELSSVTCGSSPLFMSVLHGPEVREKRLSALAAQFAPLPAYRDFLLLTVVLGNDNGDDVIVPPVMLYCKAARE